MAKWMQGGHEKVGKMEMVGSSLCNEDAVVMGLGAS
jgi:hypothetical protein